MPSKPKKPTSQPIPLADRHTQLVRDLKKPGRDILVTLDSVDCELIHYAMGIAGEAGELLDSIKKSVIYRKDIDLDNIVEELGDLEFFIEALRQALDISRAETLTHNIAKLSIRYPSGTYSNKHATERRDKQPATVFPPSPE